jgi:hypothetical protein
MQISEELLWLYSVSLCWQVECFTSSAGDVAPINLTPLIRLDHNYRVQIGDDKVVYINVCRPLLPVQGLNCVGGSSACLAHIQNGSLIHEKVYSVYVTSHTSELKMEICRST